MAKLPGPAAQAAWAAVLGAWPGPGPGWGRLVWRGAALAPSLLLAAKDRTRMAWPAGGVGARGHGTGDPGLRGASTLITDTPTARPAPRWLHRTRCSGDGHKTRRASQTPHPAPPPADKGTEIRPGVPYMASPGRGSQDRVALRP